MQVSSGGQATSTVTTSTTGPTASLGHQTLREDQRLFYAAVLPLFSGIVLVGFGRRSDGGRSRKLLGLVACCALASGLVFQAACGGGNNSTTGTSGTPSGAYTVTITGSSSSQHTVTLRLTCSNFRERTASTDNSGLGGDLALSVSSHFGREPEVALARDRTYPNFARLSDPLLNRDTP